MDVLLYLFVFLLAVVSVVDLWTNSYIFKTIRNWVSRLKYNKFLICPECFSFWVGFSLSFIFDPLIGFPGLSHFLLSHIFCGTISYSITRFLANKGIV